MKYLSKMFVLALFGVSMLGLASCGRWSDCCNTSCDPCGPRCAPSCAPSCAPVQRCAPACPSPCAPRVESECGGYVPNCPPRGSEPRCQQQCPTPAPRCPQPCAPRCQ